MNRTLLGNLTFLIGLLAGALIMRGWLDGKIPFLGSPPDPITETEETPLPGEELPVEEGGATATTLPTPTQSPSATPTPTLEPITGPTPAFGGLTTLENGWLFTAPEKIVIGPEVLSNGIINLVGESGTLYRLNPDGSAREELTLPDFEYDPEGFYIPVSFFDDGTIVVRAPDKIYAVNPDGSVRWEIPIAIPVEGLIPSIAEFGDIFLQLDYTRTLYAYTLADGLLWQYTFETSFRDDFLSPAVDDTQAYYVDSAGTLYAFSRAGLAWTYDPEEGLKAASAPILAPDGNIYYTITNSTIAFIQSLTPAGESRWRTALNTFRFFTLPEYSVGGQYIYVSEDLVRTDTGELAPVEFPFEVDSFIRGEDGFDYLLTGDNVIRWQVGPAGFESLFTYRFNAEGLDAFTDPQIRVYPSQIVEMEYLTQNGPYLVWLNPEGEVLNAMQLDWNLVRINLQQPDEVAITTCEQQVIEQQLVCKKYVAGNQDPVWEATIEGISGSFNPFLGFLIQNGQLYALTDELNLYVLALETP